MAAVWLIYVFGFSSPMILNNSPRFDTKAACDPVVAQMNTDRKFDNYLGVCMQFGTVKTRGVFTPK